MVRVGRDGGGEATGEMGCVTADLVPHYCARTKDGVFLARSVSGRELDPPRACQPSP